MKRVDRQCGNENVCPITNSGMRRSSQFFPTMLETQTITVLFVLFCKQIHVSACYSFVCVIVRSQYSSATNDLNVVDGCETLTLASLSITATLI